MSREENLSKDCISQEEISEDSNQSIKEFSATFSTPSIVHQIETKKYHLYCVSKDSKRIGIKILKSTQPTENDIQRLNNHICSFSHPALRKNINRCIFEEREALLFEWADGYALSTLTKENAWSIFQFLSMAREVASFLVALHQNDTAHLNLTSDHIIYNEQSNSVKVIYNGAFERKSKKVRCLSREEVKYADVRYISPEQSGRTNTEVDFRSDFYSLGIIFFYLLTGAHPFESEDILHLINMHILQNAPTVISLNDKIPKTISDFIYKLMEKSADDRYQSAKGIIFDLDLMLSMLEKNPQLISVELGQHDRREKFLFPLKLFGREAEYDKLCQTLGEVTPASKRAAFIYGKSGSGKTALVSALYKPVAARKGMFLRGQFDSEKSKPFSALIEAMNSFIFDLMLKDNKEMMEYKSLIKDAVKEEGRSLTNVIPSLSLLIGNQPCITESFGEQAVNRFNYVFINLLKGICAFDTPVLLLLEDFHWVDAKSLDLLSLIVFNKSLKNLMLVMTYREENKDDNLVSSFVAQSDILKPTIIHLEGFPYKIIHELICETFLTKNQESHALTHFVYNATKGNAFSIRAKLQQLLEEGEIYFCSESFKWVFHDMLNKTESNTEDVNQYLLKKLLSFEEKTKEALKVACLLGNPFPFSVLKLILNSDEGVKGILASGIICSYKGSNILHCFVHDKIKEATMALFANNENKKQFSFSIVNKLCSSLSADELQEYIYIIVNLVLGSIDTMHVKDSFMFAKLFLIAGRKAMACTAYNDAFKFLMAGVKLINDDDWATDANTCIDLHNYAAISAYCASKYDYIKPFSDILAMKAPSVLHLVPTASLQIRIANNNGNFDEALQIAFNIMTKIDMNFDLYAPKISTCKSIIFRFQNFVSSKTDDEILSIGEIKNEKYYAIARILSNIIISTVSSNQGLCRLCTGYLSIILMEQGHSIFSCICFMGLSIVLKVQGHEESYRVGKLSVKLNENFKAKEFTPLIYTNFFGSIAPFFCLSLHRSIPSLLLGYKSGVESGSYASAILCISLFFRLSILCGTPLHTMLKDIEGLDELISVKPARLKVAHQAMINLHSTTIDNPAILNGDEFQISSCFDGSLKQLEAVIAINLGFVIAYYFDDYTSALKYLQIVESHFAFAERSFGGIFYTFYQCLVHLACAKSDNAEEHLNVVRDKLRLLRNESGSVSENFMNKVYLIEAEMAFMGNEYSKSEKLFTKAISASKSNGFLNEEALSYERAAVFYIETNQLNNASLSLINASKCYSLYGAFGKLKHLIAKYPTLLNVQELNLNNISIEDTSEVSISALTSDSCFFSEKSSQVKRARLL